VFEATIANARYGRRAAEAILSHRTPFTIHIEHLYPSDIDAAVSGLFRFDREVPRDEQRRWALHVPRDPLYDEPDDGIIRKRETDKKVFLHWRPDTEALLLERGVTFAGWQDDWFVACRRIYATCRQEQRLIAGYMDKIAPGYGFEKRFEVMSAQNQHCLRILKYEPQPGMLAKTHTDRAAVTFHLAESADGLYSCEGVIGRTLHPTPPTPYATCFTGRQLAAITDGALPALYHEVRDSAAGTESRWAVVFFGKMATDLPNG
jgi:hypothetical protein